ncbi:thioredoxin family protein [Pedobacter nyackensis]|uniref:thioredoxin family protein n=1 Tax=Pedobacter nyackensis TaxID=475255 RepID=UPI00292E065E|nr:DUF255 domain-containing protein [Pedobacter nyackensis]
MKRFFLMVIMITVQASYAQQKGIEFSSQKWSDVLLQAKRENKLVFVDVFTDWCGPCKIMDTKVFPQAEVGNIYNTSFINYKIDAEKGEGPAFKKKYTIQSYPNYLFINGDGVLIYRANGSMQALEFIQQAKNAIEEYQQSTTISDLEKLYPSHKKDKKFIFNYLSRLTRLKMNTTDLIEDYINMLSSSEKSMPETIQLLVDNGVWLNRKLRLGIAITTLEENEVVFNELKSKNLVHGETLNSIKNNAIGLSLEKAIAEKDRVALSKVIAVKNDFSKNMFDNKQTIALRFQYETQDYEGFKKMNRDFINNYLLSIPLDTFLKRDQVLYDEMKREISYKHTQSIQLCNFLVMTTENLLKIPLNRTERKETMKWTAMAVHIAATDTEFYKNTAPYYQMIYAKSLYINGKRKKAIAIIGQLLNENSANPKAKKILDELLNKMKTGQKSYQL